IYTIVDEKALLDIQTNVNHEERQEVEEEEIPTSMDAGKNPMNMDASEPSNYKAPTTVDPVSYEEMPKLLQQFIDEHQVALKEISQFEKQLQRFKEERWVMDEEMAKSFSRFFNFLDTNVL